MKAAANSHRFFEAKNTPPAEFLTCLGDRLHVLPSCPDYKCELKMYPNVRVVNDVSFHFCKL